MNETVQNTTDSAALAPAVDSTAVAPVAEAVEQPVASTASVAHVGRFDEQIALMPDSIAAPIKQQLEWMPESTVFQIVETHGGGYSILYKTY